MMRTASDNAAEYRSMTTQGKDVRLALLVACSVTKSAHRYDHNDEKISINEFARLCGSGAPRIISHLSAWERMADEELVNHAVDLEPQDALTYEISDEAAAWFKANKLNGSTTPRNRYKAVAKHLTDPEYVDKVAAQLTEEAKASLIEQLSSGKQRPSMKNWKGKSEAARQREIRKQMKKGTYGELLSSQLLISRLSSALQSVDLAAELERDMPTVSLASDIQDDLINLMYWMDRASAVISAWLTDSEVREKIKQLRNISGRTPEEADSFKKLADRLERKLEARLGA